MSDERIRDERSAPLPAEVRIGPLPTRRIDLGGLPDPAWLRFARRFAIACPLCTAALLGIATIEAGNIVPRQWKASAGVAVLLAAGAGLAGSLFLFRPVAGPPDDPRPQSERDED